VGLGADASKTISQYSKGMQQRVGLAQSLLNDPKLMFMDEPTSGLDPNARREVRDLILGFRGEGRTVFVSTHELSEAQLMCDRVGIIHKGHLVKIGRVSELLRGGRVMFRATGVTRELADRVNLADSSVTFASGVLDIDMRDDQDINGVIDAVRSAGGKVEFITPREKMLEDLFIETVGGGKSQLDDRTRPPAQSKKESVPEEVAP
jgi:ABC-2 type transport system ATP-binding protein